jgi:hypothetical protein
MTNARRLAGASAIALVVAAAGAASAATATFDFRGNGGHASSYTFEADGLSLDVTAFRYSDSYAPAGDAYVGQWSNGLGVWARGDSDHQIDGYGKNDALVFSFATPIERLHSVTFHYTDWNDDFELFVEDGSGWNRVGEAAVPNDLWDWDDHSTYTFAGDYSGSLFAIGAKGHNDDFKVRGMTVDWNEPAPIPLPAGAVLLLSGVAGLAAARRRAA